MKAIYYTSQRLLEKARSRTDDRPRELPRNFDWEAPLSGLLGPAGVGKTTLLLRHILDTHAEKASLYVHAGDLYTSRQGSLLDLAQDFVGKEGEYLYIDDLHCSCVWMKEIAEIHQLFPKLKVIYAGSLLLKGEVAGEQTTLSYLTLREYINRKEHLRLSPESLPDLLSGKKGGFPFAVLRPEDYWAEYRWNGCYPFFEESDFEAFVVEAVNKTVSEEIPRFKKMTAPTADRFRSLASYLLEEAPLRPNFLKIERELGINRNELSDYITLLDKAGVILIDKTDGEIPPNRRYTVRAANPQIARIYSRQVDTEPWEETLFRQWTRNRPDFSHRSPSVYTFDGYRFRIGDGGAAGERVVTNDVDMPHEGKAPLWAFGFLR